MCASLAAEILVAPLVIYYFHNFPLMFLVANVLAFLFMELVLLFGILIIAFSGVPVIAKGLGMLTTFLVTVFNKVVVVLQQFNPTALRHLQLSAPELLIVYVTITCIAVLLLCKYRPALFIGLASCCVLLALFCCDKWNSLQQERFVVYNAGKANHIERINGDHFEVLNTDTTATEKINYATSPAHLHWQAWNERKIKSGEILSIGGKSVLILNKDLPYGSKFSVDYLVVNYTGKRDIAKLAELYGAKLIVIGNNYSRAQQLKWIQAGEAHGINVHAVAIDGAFEISNQ